MKKRTIWLYKKRDDKSQENCAIAKEYLNSIAPRFAGVNCEDQGFSFSAIFDSLSPKYQVLVTSYYPKMLSLDHVINKDLLIWKKFFGNFGVNCKTQSRLYWFIPSLHQSLSYCQFILVHSFSQFYCLTDALTNWYVQFCETLPNYFVGREK